MEKITNSLKGVFNFLFEKIFSITFILIFAIVGFLMSKYAVPYEGLELILSFFFVPMGIFLIFMSDKTTKSKFWKKVNIVFSVLVVITGIFFFVDLKNSPIRYFKYEYNVKRYGIDANNVYLKTDYNIYSFSRKDLILSDTLEPFYTAKVDIFNDTITLYSLCLKDDSTKKYIIPNKVYR